MGKTQIGELFFRERLLRLPLPLSRQIRIAISERWLRFIITALIALFLLALGTSLAIQLVQSRTSHLFEQNRLSALYGEAVADKLRLTYAAGEASVSEAGALARLLPPGAAAEARVFAVADASGRIIASEPITADLNDKLITAVLTPHFVTEMTLNSSRPTPLVLASGEEAFVAMYDLAPFAGSLVVIQGQPSVMAAWRDSVTRVTTLFVVTLLVLMLLGGAFHWQAAKAAEADSLLVSATQRLDKALDRGQCGMWDWDIPRGVIFWSKSMFEMLGMPVKGDFLSSAEVAARLHPEDAPLEDAIEDLLAGRLQAFDRELRMRHNDGHWLWLRARAALAEGEAGAPHLIGIVFDITQQKLAARLNLEAELRLKDAIENISEAFVLWDAENRLVLCNSKYQQFHSLPAGACVPGTPYDVVTRAAKEPSVRKRVSLASGERADGKSFEVQLGDRRWLQINERRTKDGGFVSVGTDITALKKQEERLLLSERELMVTVRDLQKERLLADQQAQRLADLADKYAREKTRAEAASRSES
ncbi:MAG: PAS domain-containing sensor histidine kinase, partial [Alphaproteobacteria bacterium]|nr:PAS domain-containing sensor histidine kinase [Alphaproteobacteria bacterium]